MITREVQPRLPCHVRGLSALQDLVRQSEVSGARRCAAVLFIDRLPDELARPHHVRLIRQSMRSLLLADRAQVFEIAHGRTVVVWRGHGGPELDVVRRSIDHLLSDQRGDCTLAGGRLLKGYDLPLEAECLLDDLADQGSRQHAGSRPPMDLKLLADLETILARADLACFARVRPVLALADAARSLTNAAPAWEERYFAIDDIAANLSPGRDVQAEPWLFGRLTRTLDMRMLALLSSPGTLARCGPFAINLNVATILGPAFLRFDSVLPGNLRGEVILTLRAADILAHSADFAFARNFARARLYRLALADVTAPLLGLLDAAAAGIDLLHVPLTPALPRAGAEWRQLAAPGAGLVLTGIDRPSDLRWAVANGFRLGRGALFSR